jgi:putative Holliday junction resolvase
MILGVDYGRRRVGVAAADLETRFARPLEVIDTRQMDPVARIAELAAANHATEVIVGRPVGLSGRAGPAVEEQAAFTERLREALEVPVAEYDERLTTVVADQRLRAVGVKQRHRRSRRDAVAAQVMLQGYMDSRPWH